jgi:spermidine/putrescine transport system substrate-binding protein
MIRELDHGKIPNLKNIDPVYLSETAFDKTMRVSVPYMCSPTGIGYVEGKVTDPKPSWTLLETPELKGRITLLNDSRETIGAALKALGYSLNTLNDAEIASARDLVIRWKQNIAKFESDQYNAGIASGEFLICHGYSGDLFQAQELNDKVVIVIPEEGTSIACDDLVIPTAAPSPDLAHAFINFLCEAEVAAANTEYIYYLAPNSAAYELLSDKIKNESAIFIDPVVRGKSEMIDDLGPEGNAKYNVAWDLIKAAAIN